MENYNISGFRNGVHKVKVTLQQRKYKGHIFYEMHGNCYGKTILDFDFECETEFDSDCKLQYDEDNNCFTAVLKDDEGNICSVDGDANEFNDMIVAVEIVAYEEGCDCKLN